MDDAFWASTAQPSAQPPSAQPPLPAVDVSLKLRDGRSVCISEAKASSWEGGSVWPPALLLAEYLDGQMPPGLLSLATCNVLELGSGCGAVGLVAACLGAQAVWLTDLEVALPTLQANVRLNACESTVSVCQLDWNRPTGLEASGLASVDFGLVLASECIYDEDHAQPLLRTMHQACSRASHVCVCLLSGIIGGAALAAFRREAAVYFEEQEMLPPLRAGDDHLPASRGVHLLRGPRKLGPEP